MALFSVPRYATAQAPERVPRVVLYFTSPVLKDIVAARLRDLGWGDGSIVLDFVRPLSRGTLKAISEKSSGSAPMSSSSQVPSGFAPP